jgi:hypothetical protein
MNLRKEKEKEFFVHHLPLFKKLGVDDPFFIIKTAFFQKGKFGRQSQFFEWELQKEDDIYVEFCDNITDQNGTLTDILPMNKERQLFKLKSNPYYAEEYDVKEGTNSKGETYKMYVIPANEFIAVMPDGSEISYSLYEKRKEEGKIEIPTQQKSLSVFPDFEEEFPSKSKLETSLELDNDEDSPLSEITIRDLAAIMLMKPVSNRTWLNELVKQAKSEI